MDYTQRLRDLREKNSLSLQEVANRLGMTEEQYAQYEKDANHMPNACWITLSALYGVSVDYMLCITENPERA